MFNFGDSRNLDSTSGNKSPLSKGNKLPAASFLIGAMATSALVLIAEPQKKWNLSFYDCVLDTGSPSSQVVKLLYPEAICLAPLKQNPPALDPKTNLEVESLSSSISDGMTEIRQRMIFHKILTDTQADHWIDIMSLREESPYKTEGELEYYHTKIPKVTVVYNKISKHVKLYIFDPTVSGGMDVEVSKAVFTEKK
ncbi:MAG: hypothetical protein HHAS10_11910 [Candidatus Altimarinota bacterium]